MAIIIEKQTISSRKILPDSTQKRMAWVDYARGLAIILVVYRHTMVGLQRSGIEVSSFLYNIQEFLVNVRMPVFFLLSGIFLSRSLEKKSTPELVKKKAATLLYPYVLWTIILISVQILLSDYTNSKRTTEDFLYIVTQPRELDHMWYLLALFNTTLILVLLSKILYRQPVIHLLFALVLHFAHYWFREYSLISDLCYYYIFLAIGVHVSPIVMKYESKPIAWVWKLLLITIPVFVAGQLFWLNNITDNYEPLQLWYLAPFLLIILIACVVFYCICRLLYASGMGRWLNIVGKSSLYIYILHILVISSFRIFCLKVFGITNQYFLIAGSLLLGIGLPILVYKMAERWSAVHYLFSLEKPQKK